MTEKYIEDFNSFWKKIDSRTNFSFVRYADGEVMLMNNSPIEKNTQAYQNDKWFSSGGQTKLGVDLNECIGLNDPNFYFAISSKTDSIRDYNFLYDRIQNKSNITFANLWINANYKENISRIRNINRDVVLICNENCDLKNIPFSVSEFVPFPNDCVNYWEEHRDSFLEKIYNVSSKYKDTLFIVCCGPTSAVIIKHMFTNNSNNTYIDFGSALDVFIHNKITRPYMYEGSQYNNHISKF